MAEGDGFIYNNFKEQVLLGKYILGTGGDTIRFTLHTGYTPNIDTHQVFADVSATEYTTASGYTANGKVLANQTVTQDNTNDRAAFDGDDITWTSLGALSPATPSHVICWDDTTTGDLLIAYWVLGTTATNGGNYTLQFASAGIILLT